MDLRGCRFGWRLKDGDTFWCLDSKPSRVNCKDFLKVSGIFLEEYKCFSPIEILSCVTSCGKTLASVIF
jgi:hypothetical protein